MSAVDWTAFHDPWRRIGTQFAAMLPALRDATVPPPPPPAEPKPVPTEQKLLGEALRAKRLALGLSQRELARRARCSQVEISRFERGVRRPSQNVSDRLAAILPLEPPNPDLHDTLPAREAAATQR